MVRQDRLNEILERESVRVWVDVNAGGHLVSHSVHWCVSSDLRRGEAAVGVLLLDEPACDAGGIV